MAIFKTVVHFLWNFWNVSKVKPCEMFNNDCSWYPVGFVWRYLQSWVRKRPQIDTKKSKVRDIGGSKSAVDLPSHSHFLTFEMFWKFHKICTKMFEKCNFSIRRGVHGVKLGHISYENVDLFFFQIAYMTLNSNFKEKFQIHKVFV